MFTVYNKSSILLAPVLVYHLDYVCVPVCIRIYVHMYVCTYIHNCVRIAQPLSDMFADSQIVCVWFCRTVLNAEKMQGRADVSVAALIFGSLGNFLLMFLGSAIIGILFALVAALVSVYVHTYIRTYIHTYIRTYIHTYLRTLEGDQHDTLSRL